MTVPAARSVPVVQVDVSGNGTASVQADAADVQFFHGAIAQKWGLCLWDKDCPRGEACNKHHCEVGKGGRCPQGRAPRALMIRDSGAWALGLWRQDAAALSRTPAVSTAARRTQHHHSR
jgi:hypothetical protein